jgi:hypothetical protein
MQEMREEVILELLLEKRLIDLEKPTVQPQTVAVLT